MLILVHKNIFKNNKYFDFSLGTVFINFYKQINFQLKKCMCFTSNLDPKPIFTTFLKQIALTC